MKEINPLNCLLTTGKIAATKKVTPRSSGVIVYNNFIWPGITYSNIELPDDEAVPTKIRLRVEECAEAVLNVRECYANSTLADMYNPDNEWMFPDLIQAHHELEAAYGVDFQRDEEKIVAHLFKLYAELTNDSN